MGSLAFTFSLLTACDCYGNVEPCRHHFLANFCTKSNEKRSVWCELGNFPTLQKNEVAIASSCESAVMPLAIALMTWSMCDRRRRQIIIRCWSLIICCCGSDKPTFLLSLSFPTTAIHHNPEPTQIYRFLRARHSLKVSEMCLSYLVQWWHLALSFSPHPSPLSLYLSSSPCSCTGISPTCTIVPPGEQGSQFYKVLVFSINNISSIMKHRQLECQWTLKKSHLLSMAFLTLDNVYPLMLWKGSGIDCPRLQIFNSRL